MFDDTIQGMSILIASHSTSPTLDLHTNEKMMELVPKYRRVLVKRFKYV